MGRRIRGDERSEIQKGPYLIHPSASLDSTEEVEKRKKRGGRDAKEEGHGEGE